MTEISSAINRNIRFAFTEKGITKNAAATKAGIPISTFNRKLNSDGDFTLRELGKIAEALDRQLVDILPSELLNRRAA